MVLRKNEVIPHNRPTLGLEEEIAAVDVLRSGWLAQGIEVKKFEDEVCQFLGLPSGHAIAVSSGTAALYLALQALHVKGEGVAFPAYVCSALRNATAMVGGKEVLIDSGAEHPNIDLEKCVQSGAKVGIIPHLFGIPQDLTGRTNNMYVIEDGAQAFGAMVNETPVGLQGDIGIFSFYATKIMTSGGQGGMVVSKHIELINEMKDYRHFDEVRDKKPRFNFQMTDVAAAIGRAQLRKLSQFLQRREALFERYKKAGIDLIDVTDQHIRPVRYRAIMVTDKQTEVLQALWRGNVQAVVPVRKREIEIQDARLINALSWAERTVSLPIYPSLTDEQVNRVISIISSV